MTKLPDEIYIVDPYGEDGDLLPNTEDVLWCQDPVGDVNITYVLAEKVAAALEELRAEWQHQLHCYTTRNEQEIYFERQCELEIRLRELDAIITKLGLAPERENT